MKLFENIGNWLAWAGSLIAPGPIDRDVLQKPIGGIAVPNHGLSAATLQPPTFEPPDAPLGWGVCDYSAMGTDWKSCSTANDRSCWLINTKDGSRFDINTDYEDLTPQGITRRYWLDVDSMTLSGDGYQMPYGKVFNQSMPGPDIFACWGDNIEVTVTNYLKYNGTSIHWHGIRQLNTNEADGVNAITQCPIAGYPMNDTYTYKFKALQYGSTWYHSHYSLQYADGLLGPITIFGPSSANYDEAVAPLLMSDNLHASAFQEFYKEVVPGLGPPSMDGILLNGIGQYNCTAKEKSDGVCVDQTSRHNVTVTRGKKYLMRLINTSVDTTFVFSIDNHNLTVITTDFVPIQPFVTNSVLIGIGQRYHVILEANPNDDSRPVSHQSYWIRTIPANGCSGFGNNHPANNTGILFYDDGDLVDLPTTTQSEFSIACSDEPYQSLVPIVPWEVGYPSNEAENSTFEVGLVTPPAPGPLPPPGNFSRWTLGMQPMWLNFQDPTIDHVNQGKENWANSFVVIPELSGQAGTPTEAQWIYLLISGNPFPIGAPKGRNFLPVSHPIHLHGHDFAILAQSPKPYWPGFVDYKLSNPPRRDVALLPHGGFLILAFKADNPGAWIVHCHIAWHASSGLAVQILERDGDVVIHDQPAIDRTCENWRTWHADKRTWWNGTVAGAHFQDDSGI